ncbi:MAG: GNAT family N-acetyltransferase [Bacteroidetes bacterium]|nr:GNAT family N-acetyltransferase [Bacteroidota bacterium]
MPSSIQIIPFRSNLASAFTELNRAWIERLFSLETADEKILKNPKGAIVDRGGQVFFAMDGSQPVGTVAAIRDSAGRYELAKMAVDPAHQGRGIGKLLGQAVVDFALSQGAKVLFLETSSTLPNAIRLYERLGFRHTTPPKPSEYARSDVYMEIVFPVPKD